MKKYFSFLLFFMLINVFAEWGVPAEARQMPKPEKSGYYRARLSQNQPQFDQRTGICQVCFGKGRVNNAEYNRKKLGSWEIVTCPACKGKGKTTQVINGLWGVSLGKKYRFENKEKNSSGEIEIVFTPQVKYRKYMNYRAFFAPLSKRLIRVTAEYIAPNEATANREVEIVIAQFQKKYGSEVKTYSAVPYNSRKQRYVGMIYYKPDTLKQMEIIRNMDAVITITRDHENKVVISCESEKMKALVKEEMKKSESSASDLDAL